MQSSNTKHDRDEQGLSNQPFLTNLQVNNNKLKTFSSRRIIESSSTKSSFTSDMSSDRSYKEYFRSTLSSTKHNQQNDTPKKEAKSHLTQVSLLIHFDILRHLDTHHAPQNTQLIVLRIHHYSLSQCHRQDSIVFQPVSQPHSFACGHSETPPEMFWKKIVQFLSILRS